MKRTMCNSDITESSVLMEYNGVKLYFCEQECIEEFQEDPYKFVNSDHYLLPLKIIPPIKYKDNE